jgi:hypothetical protein
MHRSSPKSNDHGTFFPGRAGKSIMIGTGQERPIIGSKSSSVCRDNEPMERRHEKGRANPASKDWERRFTRRFSFL